MGIPNTTPEGAIGPLTTEESVAALHPGITLREGFLEPIRMTPYRLAKGLKMTETAIHEILKGKRSITAETALRLEKFFGTSPGWWLRLQMDYDLRLARLRMRDRLEEVETFDLESARKEYEARCEEEDRAAAALTEAAP